MTASASTQTLPLTLETHLNQSEGLLLRHVKREQWGLAMVHKTQSDRVSLVFQDGRVRRFKEGYYHFLEIVDRPFDVRRRVVDSLESIVGKKLRKSAKKVAPVSPGEQADFFLKQFPDGFSDEAYRTNYRSNGKKRLLKRHRDGAILAASSLARRPMAQAIKERDTDVVYDAVKKVAASSDLISMKERKALAAIKKSDREQFVDTLFALLHGRAKFSARFDAFVNTATAAMSKSPSWNLVTLLLAATKPGEYHLVDFKSVERQSQWMAPGLHIPELPTSVMYARLGQLLERLQDELKEDDLAPIDTFDLCTFMQLTLKPSAQKSILGARRKKLKQVKVSMAAVSAA